MDHKDLLNDVVKNMAPTSAEEENVTSTSEAVDYGNETIDIQLSTGDTYSIKVSEFDWDLAVKNLHLMDINIHNINVLVNALFLKNDDNPAVTQLKERATELQVEPVDLVISELSKFLTSYNVTFDYTEKFSNDIPKETIALLMAYDAQIITRTLHEHVMIYNAMVMFRSADNEIDRMLDSLHDDLPEEVKQYANDDIVSGNKELMYVEGKIEESVTGIASLVKDSLSVDIRYDEAMDPSKQYIVCMNDNETVGVFVMARSTDEAISIATDIFNEFVNDYNESITDSEEETEESMTYTDLMSSFGINMGIEDDHDVSGLIS